MSPCDLALLLRPVGLGQHRRRADEAEVPADAEQDQRHPEIARASMPESADHARRPPSSAMPTAMIGSLPKRAISAAGEEARREHREHVPLDAERGVVLAEAAGDHGERRRGHHQAHHARSEPMAQSTATMKRGWRTISRKRPAAVARRRPRRRHPGLPPSRDEDDEADEAPAPAIAKKAPAKGIGSSRSRVKITVCGPITADAMPPASTQEIARRPERRAAAVGRGETVLLGEGAGDAEQRASPTMKTAKRAAKTASAGDEAAGDRRSATPVMKPRRRPIRRISMRGRESRRARRRG